MSQDALEDASNEPSVGMRLNHICLRAIFDELSLPAKLFLDSALHCGPQSPWSQSLRTWKSLVLVCRNWHAAATPYLYRNVVLRRTGQVPALVKTLKDNEDFDSMIRYLTISCYVPDEWDEVMNDNVAYLLSKCHNIRSLYLLSFFTQWLHALTPDGTRRFKIPNEILSSASSIEILCYGYEHPEYFFSGKEYTVGPAGMTAEQADVNYYHVFSSLPNVRSLRILMDPHISTSFKWRPFVVSFKKQHLAQIRSDPIKFGTRRYLRDLDDKLETYRVDLALWSTIHFQLPSLLIREIGRDFDNIHIVMDTLLRNRSILGPNTWVDMWVSDMTLFEDGVHSPFDRRRRYRLLDNRLRSLGGLPYVFPPEKSRTRRHENYIYTHDIFGMRFTRTAKRISYIEEPWGKIYETPESEVSTDSDDIIDADGTESSWDTEPPESDDYDIADESDDESETDSSDGNWTSDNSGSLDAAGQYESSSEDTSNDDDSLGSTVPVTEEELSGLFLPAGELITNIIP